MEQYNKLKEGQEFRSYREVCEFLEVKVKTGNGKKLQIGRWKEQFTWGRVGNSWVVRVVHINPDAELDSLTTIAAVTLLSVKYVREEVREGRKIEIENWDLNSEVGTSKIENEIVKLYQYLFFKREKLFL